MKKHLFKLSLGLAAALAGTSAFANTGTINFEGRITAGTCPIDVINPGDGTAGSVVNMGTVPAVAFTAAGQEKNGHPFALRVVDPGQCGLTGTDDFAKVTFNGTPDASGDYFAVGNGPDTATGVAIVIKDKAGPVKPGAESAEYDLHPTLPTDMNFNAYYRSTAATVTPGAASASVQFVVAIN